MDINPPNIKNSPAMWETWVRSLGWEDPLEEGMATHSSILAWRISMDRGAWWATVHGVAELDSTEQLSTALHNQIFLDRNSNLELQEARKEQMFIN